MRLLTLLLAVIFLTGCEPATKQDTANLQAKVDSLERKIDFLQKNIGNPPEGKALLDATKQISGQVEKVDSRLDEISTGTFEVKDTENNRSLGYITKTAGIQKGDYIKWDDDIYEVLLIMHESHKTGEMQVADGVVWRMSNGGVVVVRFSSKTKEPKATN